MKVIPFKIKYISVVACCEECTATWIAHLRENDYLKYLVDREGVCCYCKSKKVRYCRRE